MKEITIDRARALLKEYYEAKLNVADAEARLTKVTSEIGKVTDTLECAVSDNRSEALLFYFREELFATSPNDAVPAQRAPSRRRP